MPDGLLELDENTIAHWHFDGNRGDYLDDASRNGHARIGVDLIYYSVEAFGTFLITLGPD